MYLGRTKLALVWTSSMFIKLTYADIYSDFHSNKLALGMLSDAPLVTFLKEHPQITTIKFCLDNDKPGRTATEQKEAKLVTLCSKGRDLIGNPQSDKG